jgi:hypothetical protein
VGFFGSIEPAVCLQESMLPGHDFMRRRASPTSFSGSLAATSDVSHRLRFEALHELLMFLVDHPCIEIAKYKKHRVQLVSEENIFLLSVVDAAYVLIKSAAASMKRLSITPPLLILLASFTITASIFSISRCSIINGSRGFTSAAPSADAQQVMCSTALVSSGLSIQKLNCLFCRDDDKFDAAPAGLAPDFVHDGQRPICASPHHEAAAVPWYVLGKESGVCPNSLRNSLDAFFLRLNTSPCSITTS